MSAATELQPAAPRLGFVGAGWIGRHRLEAVVDARAGIVAAVCEPSQEACDTLRERFPEASFAADLREILEMELDGIVIATPSALHADQSIAALERAVAVFCQKPLGRNAAETARVISAARKADRLLGIDFSYRYADAFIAAREVVRSGELGEIFGIDLVFHNAYGPDKQWFYDPSLSGGGCLVDLGIHLVDVALWTLERRDSSEVRGRLMAGGSPLSDPAQQVEDYAVADFRLGDAAVRLACSWRLPAGRDAVIEASFYGTRGGVSVKNVNGSFYDFIAERYEGTKTTRLVDPPDAWGGRAAVEWARRLNRDGSFDPSVEQAHDVATILDRIYGREAAEEI